MISNVCNLLINERSTHFLNQNVSNLLVITFSFSKLVQLCIPSYSFSCGFSEDDKQGIEHHQIHTYTASCVTAKGQFCNEYVIYQLIK